jgi:ABC-2 type transport system ATP-binding protein
LVGILLEAKAFHPTRTARQHLQVLAAAGDVPARRVDEALASVGLETVGDRRPGTFSLGMAQRLGIAAAVLAEPRYLILDEPANGLDPEGMVWLRRFLRDYTSRGNGVFISSHQLGELARLIDDVVVIGRGRLIASGAMRDVLASRSHAAVFVRSPGLPQLRRLFDARGMAVCDVEDGVDVTGISSAEVGVLALEAGVPLEELRPREASLEEVFFELTEDVEEFRAGTSMRSEGS